MLPIPLAWNSETVLTARVEFVTKMCMMAGRQCIFIDESGFNLHCKKSKGRAVAGEKAVLTVLPKGKRISLIAALSNNGMCYHKLLNHTEKKGTNSDDFRSFILDLLAKIPRSSVLILDNVKIHHVDKVQVIF